MARRLPAVALVSVLAFALVACTGDDDDATSNGTGATSATSAPGGGSGQPSGGSTLDRVRSAGVVRCGTRDDLPGFASIDASGNHVGFDADFCRVIAAGVLGDANAVEFVDVETADRFTELQSGGIDVLVRNTTYTATRDGTEGATFLTTTFYDGQAMMVATDSGIDSIEDLSGGVVCVAGGTTTEGNVATEFARLGLDPPEVLSFESVDVLQQAFQEGRCDGWSSDLSQLTGLRSNYPDGPEALTILPGTFSKEPLTPAVRDNDSRWAQAVNWTILATIQAEEFGLTSANVDQMRDETQDQSLRYFLGLDVDGAVLDPGLGLPPDFAYQIVKQVGSYAEIFERNLAELGIERGLNALYTDGGLLYAPPYR